MTTKATPTWALETVTAHGPDQVVATALEATSTSAATPPLTHTRVGDDAVFSSPLVAATGATAATSPCLWGLFVAPVALVAP